MRTVGDGMEERERSVLEMHWLTLFVLWGCCLPQEGPGCALGHLGSLGSLGHLSHLGLPGALGRLHQPCGHWQPCSPCCHALPLPAGLPGDAVRVLEAVDVRQVHVLGHARHVRRVQLLVAIGTPAMGIIMRVCTV